MARLGFWRALGAGALLAVGVPVVHQAMAEEPAPFAWADVASMVPGTAAASGGQWAFTDYVYDDHGTGAFAYPEEGSTANDADIAILQVAATADDVRYLVRLGSLAAPDRTVVALAVDTDCDDATGGGAWPLGADVSSPGWEHVITAWGTGGEVDGAAVDVVADSVANTIEIRVPRAVMDPGTGAWCYRGGAGLWDVASSSWLEMGDGPDVFNLLFRNRLFDGGTDATDENSSPSFQYAKQSAALAAGDISAFTRRVDFGALAAGDVLEPALPTDDHSFTRIYETAGFPNALPEGVSSSGVQNFLYNGRYHPYILFVPVEYWTRPAGSTVPLIPMLHGWRGDHRGFNNMDGAFGTQVVRPNGALVAKAFGRGQEIWWEHAGELDVLEIIADVVDHYAVDEDRVYLGGTSMGGLGTVKIVASHPDVFAGAFPSVPPMGDRAQGYALPQNNDWDLVTVAGSFRNVPVRNFTGTYDALVPAGNDSRRFCDALRAAVYDHDCWRDIHPSTGTHRGFENDRAAEIARLLADHPRRVENPARVTYQSHPAFRAQAARTGLADQLRYDHAYWVTGIEWPAPPDDPACYLQAEPRCSESPGIPDFPTDPGTPRRLTSGEGVSTIDVRTFGLGVGDPVATEIADDPSPTLVRDGMVLTAGPPVPAENRFELAVDGVVAVDLELSRMGLTAGGLTGALSGDGPLSLGLVGDGVGTCTATLDGAAVPATTDADGVRVFELDLRASPETFVVSCSGA